MRLFAPSRRGKQRYNRGQWWVMVGRCTSYGIIEFSGLPGHLAETISVQMDTKHVFLLV